MIVLVASGAVDSGYTGSQQPIVQNLGPGELYIGTADADLITTGLYLPVGAVYEFPVTIVEGSGALWLQASGGQCDVRIINVG